MTRSHPCAQRTKTHNDNSCNMLESKNPAIDIDSLLERIHQEVARQKGRSVQTDGMDRPAPLAIGSVLHFGKKGNAAAYVRSGWGQPESEHQWTDGHEAELAFELPVTNNDLILSFAAEPLIGGKSETQHVQAEWNGVLVGEWSIHKSGTYATIVWSRHLQASPMVLLRFILPDALSPVALGLSQDTRKLGLCFREFRLSPFSDTGA